MEPLLTTLDLRSTPLWPSFDDDPENFPDAGRIQGYLERHGVIFPADGSGGVQVFNNGFVQVVSITDPTPVWNAFNNEPTQEETLLESRLQTALTIRNKLADGTATAEDRNTGLRIALTLLLRLYLKET
jgi:hypothetical protein